MTDDERLEVQVNLDGTVDMVPAVRLCQRCGSPDVVEVEVEWATGGPSTERRCVDCGVQVTT